MLCHRPVKKGVHQVSDLGVRSVASAIKGGYEVFDDQDPGVRDYDEKMVHVETSTAALE
jgi:hypothetical protein